MGNKWLSFLTDYYNKVKQTNPKYSWRDAMVDAKKVYSKTTPPAINLVSSKMDELSKVAVNTITPGIQKSRKNRRNSSRMNKNQRKQTKNNRTKSYRRKM